jgi:hypothetical protein
MTNLIPLTANPAIISGPLQFNRMGVMAIGSNLRLYANGVLVGQITDTTYASGYAGAFINQNNTPDMKMQVDMMSYWKDPAP